MKVCLVSARRDPTVRPIDYDGGGNHVFNYACQLAAIGYEVHIVTQLENLENTDNIDKAIMQQSLGGEYYFDDKNGVHFHRLKYTPVKETNYKDADVKFIKESASFCKSLADFYNKNSNVFDVYHYFHMFSVSGFISNSNKIPFPEKSIFSPLLPSLGRTYESCIEDRVKLEKLIFNTVKFITYNSDSEKNIIRKKYGIQENKLFSSLPGIDLRIFNRSKTFNKTKTSNFTIIYPNAIRPQKRQLFLVRTLIQLLNEDKNINYKFILSGRIVDNKYFNKIIKEIEKNKVTYNLLNKNSSINHIQKSPCTFIFINGLDHNKLSKMLKSSNLAIFPSLDETFGISVIEAMACGIPIICHRLKAYKSFVKDSHTAYTLSRKATTRDVLNKIIEIMNLDKVQVHTVTTNGAIKAKEFSWENVVCNLVTAYHEIKNIEYL